jgi:ribosome-binding protein aMBF1 (putative translation factor)
MLKNAIEKKGISLQQLCFQLAKRDVWVDKALLSKMQNGKYQPADDSVNVKLAEILEIDSAQFRLAAAREKLPHDLYELIKNQGNPLCVS